jgi:hypothetical protein
MYFYPIVSVRSAANLAHTGILKIVRKVRKKKPGRISTGVPISLDLGNFFL